MTADEEWDPRLQQLGEYIRVQRQLADSRCVDWRT